MSHTWAWLDYLLQVEVFQETIRGQFVSIVQIVDDVLNHEVEYLVYYVQNLARDLPERHHRKGVVIH